MCIGEVVIGFSKYNLLRLCMFVKTNRIKILTRKTIDIGEGSCSFASLTYCILDKNTAPTEPGYYRLQITDCSSAYFVAESRIKHITKKVLKLKECVSNAILLSDLDKRISKRRSLSRSEDVVFQQMPGFESLFKIESKKRPISLGPGNGVFQHPKKTYFTLHATDIIVARDYAKCDLHPENKEHFLLRLKRLEIGLDDFLLAIKAVVV